MRSTFYTQKRPAITTRRSYYPSPGTCGFVWATANQIDHHRIGPVWIYPFWRSSGFPRALHWPGGTVWAIISHQAMTPGSRNKGRIVNIRVSRLLSPTGSIVIIAYQIVNCVKLYNNHQSALKCCSALIPLHLLSHFVSILPDSIAQKSVYLLLLAFHW